MTYIFKKGLSIGIVVKWAKFREPKMRYNFYKLISKLTFQQVKSIRDLENTIFTIQ
jgi:hypothetical protein